MNAIQPTMVAEVAMPPRRSSNTFGNVNVVMRATEPDANLTQRPGIRQLADALYDRWALWRYRRLYGDQYQEDADAAGR